MAPSYSAVQRSAVTQFVSFTQAKESVAARFLKNHSWNVEQAIDAFYQSGTGINPVSSLQTNLSKLFDQYRDHAREQPDRIGIEGVEKYLTDLNVALVEVTHLALCELVQCSSIGEFEREKFIAGWRSATTSNSNQPCDTLSRQASYVSTIRNRLGSDTAFFKQIYRYTFTLAKAEGQKSVPMDSALEFWRMFFGSGSGGGVQWNSATTPWLDLWLEFYETRSKRPVNKDLWNMVGELVLKTKEPGGESLDWWEEDGAWPMAVDEFVEFVKERRKQEDGGASMDVS